MQGYSVIVKAIEARNPAAEAMLAVIDIGVRRIASAVCGTLTREEDAC
jgi:hypothetical protein